LPNDPGAEARAEAVVFDLGGVLIDWDPRHLYRKLFDGDETKVEWFLTEVCTFEWHASTHDVGVPLSEGCAARAAEFPEHAELVMAWRRQDEMIGGAFDNTVEVLAELRDAGVPLYVLSNWEVGTWPDRVRQFDFLSWFDGIVISGQELVRKPDPEIFRRLIDRFGLDPNTTLFVDDVAANCEAAKRLGFQAHHFESAAMLRHTLRTLHIL
jgi:2-haloacid dehalogenase